MYWMHRKSDKNRTEPNELDELKYSKSLTRWPIMHTDMFSYLHAQTCIKTFMPSKIRKKDWAKWAKWARILNNTLTDEQPCLLTCFLAFACSDKYQNIYSFFRFNIRKKIELNELDELEYSKAPSTMGSYTQEHDILYLHAQTNISPLLYWSYTKS